ncbi:phosphatidylinositol 3,4,5-trisphosphate 5-phosphatase 1 isoform X3 [Scleropages formosus]|uniref:phosphatidylinositol 3,4,5-trisphosphate 5-phosphatase 1 isoform X3 n=1 Tax=Scleropages formosus TaxID=113540 RepID=UPI000878341B|nr:phosphatidylinositol 3,4,5-trisphosphate 5-phosphatase 1 isoform X3 [Scleropages formosus]
MEMTEEIGWQRYQNCVYTYRILPNEERKLSVQASEGVPIRFFSVLSDLVDEYYKENMGLVTHLQFPVQKEEEPEEESEPINVPPQLPPRNFTSSTSVNDTKEPHGESLKGPEPVRPSLSDTLLQRLQHLDTSNIPDDHLKSIQDYLRNLVSLDAEQVQTGNFTLPYLKQVTHGICKNLQSEISRTLPILEAFQKVLDQQMSPGIGRLRSQVSSESSLPVAVRLEQITRLLYSIEEKAKVAMYDGVGYDGGHRRSLIPPVTFEVKSDVLGISTKMYIKVDVEGGKVYFKKSKDGPEDKYYMHNKILQLVKSQKVHAKLVIILEMEKEKTSRKEFAFEDSKKREGFCQLLQQMKNKHTDKPEPDMITIFIGTWNMGNTGPPQRITSWFQSKGQGKTLDDTADHIPHDIYIIGSQEDPLGEKEWTDILKSTLRGITNISFKQVAIHTLWNIRIVVLAKPEHENRISHVFSDSVKTGIANALGNKGAVGVSFMFNDTSFGFVNSHLTSGSEKKIRRNQNYINILRFLNLGDKKLNPFDITHRFTHLFWLGDLNYRIEMPSSEAENIVAKIKQQQYQELLKEDQLSQERAAGRVFLHYEEEEITFAPTYRFERETREKYAYTKAKATGTKYNLPSWCDRVLRKSYPLAHVVCQSYGCTADIMTSDHSPVFATFEVGVTSQFVSKNDPSSVSQGGIKFMNCMAILNTKSKTKFFIECHSSCLESFVKSPEGENQEHNEGSLKVRFGSQIELTPIISDPEYLLDQHILICIKSTDCEESYGEGCVALRAAATCKADFHIVLTHHGEITGSLTGSFQLQTSEGKQTEKLYDFIQVERDDSGAPKGRNAEPFGSRSTHHMPTNISNPSYMGVGYKTGNLSEMGWSYNMPPKTSPPGSHVGKDMAQGNLSPKKTAQDLPVADDGKPPEMFDNPLYGSRTTSKGGLRPKEHLYLPEAFPASPKSCETEGDRIPPLPMPRNRSFTCSSESKPQPPTTLQLPNVGKKPVVPSRSEGGMLPGSRPPLPMKSRSGQPEPQPIKPRDYRDSSELPSKGRPPPRSGQPLPKEVHQEGVQPAKSSRPVK